MIFGPVKVTDVVDVIEIFTNCKPVAVLPVNETAPPVDTTLPDAPICMSQLFVVLPVFAPIPVTEIAPEVEVNDIGQTSMPR